MFEHRLLHSHKRATSDASGYVKNTKLSPQLRYLGMGWIMIKSDDTKARSPYQKGFHPKIILAQKFASDKKLQIHNSLSQKDLITTRTKFSTQETGRSLFEEEMLNDARKILQKEKGNRIKLELKLGAQLNLEQGLSPMSLEATSPINHDDIYKNVRTMDNFSLASTETVEDQETLRKNLVQSLVKMIESNAEYEDLLFSKGKKPATIKQQTKNTEEVRDDQEIILKARRNGDMRFQSNPLMFFVSPTGVANASAVNTKIDSNLIIQSSMEKETNEGKNRKVSGQKMTAVVFDTENNKEIVHSPHSGPEKYLSDNLDYEIFLKAEKDRWKEISLPHEMKNLLDKFSSTPGKKVYKSPAVIEEKIRLEAKLMKKDASKQHSIFSGHSFTVSPKQLKLPHLSPSKQKVNNNLQTLREMIEKSLSELLFERFKARLPEIQERGSTYGRTKADSKNRQQLVDNAFNLRKIYDAWYLKPSMRAQKLKASFGSP